MSLTCVVLGGGAGTRLWPLSRESQPKQFLSPLGGRSLFQDTILRCKGALFDPRPIVVASERHRFLVAENLRDIGVDADILLEPVSRNSAAAVTAGCLQALSRDPDATVLVLAADHRVEDQKGFIETIGSALPLAKSGYLIAFGIKPESPATGFGYIEPGENIDGTSGFKVTRFVEKPEQAAAEQYLDAGFLWNSGNFMFRANTFLDELRHHNPGVLMAVEKALLSGHRDLDFFRLGKQAFSDAERISVDFAVMEKTQKAAVVPAEHDWSDIGTWHAVWRNHAKDEDGNAARGQAMFLGSAGNMVHSEHHLTALVGVENLAVVATRDSVLVAAREKSERIGDLVDNLSKSGIVEAKAGSKTYRPWGNYEAIDAGPGYQVKRIEILPGGELSLQKHERRAEHWIVVEGTPDVTLEGEITRLEPNQSIYIPIGAVHRLGNSTDERVILIEVQTGSYFGEDDIVRLEDRYNRQSSE